MLDLAIFNDCTPDGVSTVETNQGEELTTSDWPTDCDFQIVAYRPSESICEVVSPTDLAEDISYAIEALQANGGFKAKKPDWFKRLELYAGSSI